MSCDIHKLFDLCFSSCIDSANLCIDFFSLLVAIRKSNYGELSHYC